MQSCSVLRLDLVGGGRGEVSDEHNHINYWCVCSCLPGLVVYLQKPCCHWQQKRNKIAVPDIYPVLLQQGIIAAIGYHRLFFLSSL